MKYWQDGPVVTTNLFDHIVAVRQLEGLDSFISPRWPDDLHDPFLLPDMDKAVTRIWRAIEQGEKIGVVGDYDMDGTPAAALMASFFRLLGQDPLVILPTRADGYGFAPEFVDRLAAQNVTLIITVDCGIRDQVAVGRAKERNIDVIITDHHECPEDLPPALAVINPKRHDSIYPWAELCGTGVAFKLVQALISQAPESLRTRIPEAWLAWQLDLVGLATLSDMVPLLDENRLFAYYGLKVIQKGSRLGLRRFLSAIDLSLESVTYRDIAFKIVPKFNASGRMETMDEVLTLLMSQDSKEVDQALTVILTRSTQSQLILSTMLEQARSKIQTELTKPIILLAEAEWHPGLTGIVAGRLSEEHQRPVGIFAGVGEESYRGSMRSIPGISLPTLLQGAAPYLEKFGGHEQAAGLSLAKANFTPFYQVLTDTAPKPSLNKMAVTTDGIINPDQINLSDLDQLTTLAPWGIDHPEPMWSLVDVRLSSVQWLSQGAHLKASIVGDHGHLSLIMFGAADKKPLVDTNLDIYGTLTVNEFRGLRQPQLTIRGLVPHQSA